MKKYFRNCVIALLVAILFGQSLQISVSAKKSAVKKGFMMYHSYSSYEAEDSQIYKYDFAKRKRTCISKKWTNVHNAMNVSINKDGKTIVFMGQVKSGEWDIFLYKFGWKNPKNLTKGNRLNDEDPKFDSTGKKIIFKQSNKSGNGSTIIQYTLKEKKFKRLITGKSEKSMPYFSKDARNIYYVTGEGRNMKLNCATLKKGKYRSKVIYSKKNVQCYYPIVGGDKVYFSRWYSSKNHADQIYIYNSKTGKTKRLKCNSKDYDTSDACVVSSKQIIVSSTKNTKSRGYDLFLVNVKTGKMQSLSTFDKGINSKKNELGCAYYVE